MANRLLIEGQDDFHVVKNLLFNHGRLDELVELKEKKGISSLLADLDEEIRAPDADRLAIVVDADVAPGARWAQIEGILVKCGIEGVPSAPEPEGTVLSGEGTRKIGIWIMPDNSISGGLEEFVSKLIDPGDVLWPRAQQNVTDIPPADRRFGPTHVGKAMIHTWLAWQEEPGTPMGGCFRRKYLDPAGPHAMRFVAWLRRLLT